MPQLHTSRGTVFYDEHGSGEPLLLLHANPGDPRDFDAVLPALAERYRVIRICWPGYGGATAPLPPSAATPQLFAEMLERFVIDMKLDKLRLVGNSIGAWAAIQLALKQPDRVQALVLVSPAGFTTHTPWTRLFCALKGKERVTRWLNGFMAFLYLRLKTAVTQAMRERARLEQRTPEAVAVNAALWRRFVRDDFDLRAAAAGVRAKTMVVSGRRDPLIPAAEGALAARTIPGAAFIVLPCGHAAFAEMPATFLDVVQPFFASCCATSAAPLPRAPLGKKAEANIAG